MKKKLLGALVGSALLFAGATTVPLVPTDLPCTAALGGVPIYDSTSGDLEPGQYALDQTGKGYYVNYPPVVSSTSTDIKAAEQRHEDTPPEGLKEVHITGEKSLKLCGEMHDQPVSISNEEYAGYKTAQGIPSATVYAPLLDVGIVSAASPTLTGSVASSTFASAASDTLSLTTGSGSNLAVIVLVGVRGANGAPSSCTQAGTTMSQLFNMTGAQQTSGLMYYLAAPTTGTNNVVCNWSPNQAGWMVTWTFQDIVQSSPAELYGQGNTASATSLSLSTTTLTNSDAVVTWIDISTTGTSLTLGASQIQLSLDRQTTVPTANLGSSYIAKATAGAITTSFSWTTATNGDIFDAGLKYIAPPAAGAAQSGEVWAF